MVQSGSRVRRFFGLLHSHLLKIFFLGGGAGGKGEEAGTSCKNFFKSLTKGDSMGLPLFHYYLLALGGDKTGFLYSLRNSSTVQQWKIGR